MKGKFSFYRSVRIVEPAKSVGVDKFLNGIRAGHWRRDVERCREVLETKGERAFKDAKASLPCVTPWGVFETRRNDGLVVPSGVMVIDLDGPDNPEVSDWEGLRDELGLEDWVYGAFLSPSGRGLKVFVLVAEGALPLAVMGEVQEILKVRGLVVDPSGKDAARACFVSYDPGCYVADEDKVVRVFEGVAAELSGVGELEPVGGERKAGRAYKLVPYEDEAGAEVGSDVESVGREDDEKRFLRYLDALAGVTNRLEYADWVNVISACVAMWGAERAAAEMGARWPEEKAGEYYAKCKRPQPCASAHAMLYSVCVANGAEVKRAGSKPGGKPARKGEKKAAGRKKAEREDVSDKVDGGDDDGVEATPYTREGVAKLERIKAREIEEKTADFYYDGPNRFYWDEGTQFILKNTSDVKHKLVKRRLRRTLEEWELTSQLADAVEYIQDKRYVSYSGALAGKRRGVYRYGGKMLLATFGPEIIEPEEGECPLIEGLIDALLLDGTEAGARQKRFLYGWLQMAYLSLVNEAWRAGQCLVLAGCRGGGKTLLKRLIVLLLGGRVSGPWAYMTGLSRFNSELAAAECLVVDDEAGSTDTRVRKMIAAKIKSMLFSRSISVESKGREPFQFEPFWRMVFCVNDDPESLLVLPILSEDMEDKIAFLQCGRWECPLPNFTYDERKEVDRRFDAELPCFLHKVLAFEIPEDEREDRCGVVFFHHPALLESMGTLAPENEMLALVDEIFEKMDPLAVARGSYYETERTAKEWERLIMIEGGNFAREGQRLFSWNRASGVYLGKLARGKQGRVTKGKMINGVQKWRIEGLEAWERRQLDARIKGWKDAGVWFEVKQVVVLAAGDVKEDESGARLGETAWVMSRDEKENSYVVSNGAWVKRMGSDGRFGSGYAKVFGWQLKEGIRENDNKPQGEEK